MNRAKVTIITHAGTDQLGIIVTDTATGVTTTIQGLDVIDLAISNVAIPVAPLVQTTVNGDVLKGRIHPWS